MWGKDLCAKATAKVTSKRNRTKSKSGRAQPHFKKMTRAGCA